MTHKLTKFQTQTWEKIQPIIKKHPYEVTFNFDDDFVITQQIKDKNYTITLFPKDEVSFTIYRPDGGSNLYFYSDVSKFLYDLKSLVDL
jgi:hypothetical protein